MIYNIDTMLYSFYPSSLNWITLFNTWKILIFKVRIGGLPISLKSLKAFDNLVRPKPQSPLLFSSKTRVHVVDKAMVTG
jgi:hypothetical protein